ncbi:hypothetical protein SVIOM74S_05568 [Streptomyces violarus]
MPRQVRRRGRQQRGRAEAEYGDGRRAHLPDGRRDRRTGTVGHGEPRALQPVGDAAHRVRRGGGGPQRRYPGLPLGADGPDDRPLHLVAPARIDDRRPAGVGQEQPALAVAMATSVTSATRRGPPERNATSSSSEFMDAAGVRVGGRGAYGGQAQARARRAGHDPGRQQEKNPEHMLFVCDTVSETPCLVHDPDGVLSVCDVPFRCSGGGRKVGGGRVKAGSGAGAGVVGEAGAGPAAGGVLRWPGRGPRRRSRRSPWPPGP